MRLLIQVVCRVQRDIQVMCRVHKGQTLKIEGSVPLPLARHQHRNTVHLDVLVMIPKKNQESDPRGLIKNQNHVIPSLRRA